jgi:hydroxyacylglutathione hydrolase
MTGRLAEIAPGVLVATAELYTTTSTVVVGPNGDCLVIDPAVSVAEVTALAGELTAAGLRVVAGFATHPHWDHLLWHADLGDGPRYAAPAAVTAAEAHRGEMLGETEESAPGHDPELFGRVVAVPGELVPWDGPAAQVIVHDAHAPGHGALFLPDSGVLVAGDMLSDIEIPLLDLASADPLGDYRRGLDWLAAVDGVRWVVPGHGHVGDAAELRVRIEADRGYLDRLSAGERFGDPRLTVDWLRQEHERQLSAAAGWAG